MKIAISLVIVYLGIDSTVFPFEQGFEKNLFSLGGWGLGFYLIWAVYVSLVPKIMVFELFWSIKGTYRFCPFWPEINRVCFFILVFHRAFLLPGTIFFPIGIMDKFVFHLKCLRNRKRKETSGKPRRY